MLHQAMPPVQPQALGMRSLQAMPPVQPQALGTMNLQAMPLCDCLSHGGEIHNFRSGDQLPQTLLVFPG